MATSPAAITPRRARHLDLALGEAEQRGQQRHRGDHGDQHGDRSAGGETVDERQAHDEHAEQRDHHGEAGEDHGSAGGVERDDGRLLGIEPRLQTLSISSDDEECVVDADTDADHGAERDGEIGHRHDIREQGDDARADPDTEQCHADRQAHGEHRTEREDQDDDCEAETDQLGFGRFELAERLATDLHLETIDVGRPQIRDLGTDLAGLGFAERLRKIDLRVGDLSRERSVGGDQPERLALRRVRARERDPLDDGDLVEELGHRGLNLGIVDALIGAEDDRARATATGSTEIGVERVEAALRLRVGNRERAVARRTDGAHEREHGDQRGHPGAEDEPAASEAEASELAPCRVGDLDRDVRCAVSGLVRAVGIIGLTRRVLGGSGRHVHYWTF